MAEQHPAPSTSVRSPAQFERWEMCSVCGFDYPVSKLTRDQWHRLVCPDCVDEPSNEDYENESAPRTTNMKPPWSE